VYGEVGCYVNETAVWEACFVYVHNLGCLNLDGLFDK
jgi:hypothetical protein